MADADPSKKYDQAFFLALATKGKDTWNAWRRDPANKDVRVTFAGIDFSVAPRDQINFEGFEFKDYADFSSVSGRTVFNRAVFGDHAKFGNAIFGGAAYFTAATFGFDAQFCCADFGGGATFQHTKFGHVANFTGATFGTGVTFERATFGSGTLFKRVTLGYQSVFKRAVFRGDVSFDGADFGTEAWFEEAIFGGRVEFEGRSKEDWNNVFQSQVAALGTKGQELLIALKDRHNELWTRYQSAPDRFPPISFANARFDGEAVFSGRSFERAADFTTARFYYPPDFDTATNTARIDFTGAYIRFAPPGKLIHWTKDSHILIRLRAFRKIAEETKNHDLERDLYIEERKAERGVYLRQLFEDLIKEPWKNWPRNAARLLAHLLWILVMGVYWALADYGRSFARPAIWLAASVWLFHLGYSAILAPLMQQAGEVNAAKYARAEWMVALGNAVPFVGPLTIDAEIKKFLFCPGFGPCLPIPPEGFQLLVIGQNLLSIICVFFIGLALRNYFRIK